MTDRDAEPYLNDPERQEILRRLAPLWAVPRAGMDDAEFNAVALAVYRFQLARCPPFARLCGAAGAGPDLADWRGVPLVPTDAFKTARMACFSTGLERGRFLTSGTTAGGISGAHPWIATDIYDAAAVPWLALHLVPERFAATFAGGVADVGALRFVSLTRPPAEAPHSSLTHMIDAAGRALLRPGEGPVHYAYGPGGLRFDDLAAAIGEARGQAPGGANQRADQGAGRGAPAVVLFATAFALVQALDEADARGASLALPPGSRIMETGGYKGRTRALAKAELYARASRVLAVPPERIMNEYGMTEMSSQFYDDALRAAADAESRSAGGSDAAPEHRLKRPPPWVRTRVLDPVTMLDVPDGEVGVLAHVDLANVDSCAFLLTADAARARRAADGSLAGFELLGRMADIEPRGCSLDYEEIAP